MRQSFMIRKLAAWLMISVCLSCMLPHCVYGEEEAAEKTQEDQGAEVNLGLQSRASLLMEASTGTVIYEQNADEKLSPASITKIMTLVLIFDALEKGQIHLEDTVTTSAHAKSMGGSQVFLEEGEVQTVDTLIKCIIVASGNDASVAMAEYIAGSESEFVRMMNERAKGLGMDNTCFEDCCGLTDSDGHYTTARDVALMSRELITKYPQIKQYSGIWMENITHVTAKGTSEFGLANTNKLLKQYQWTTGLKTGSTSKAKYCVSATAEKDGIELIAVIMAAPDYKIRFSEAASLLDYGYAHCSLYQDEDRKKLKLVKVNLGVKQEVRAEYQKPFSYLSTAGENVQEIKSQIKMKKEINAPVKKGDVLGQIHYYLGDKEVGAVDITAAFDVPKSGYGDCLKRLLQALWI